MAAASVCPRVGVQHKLTTWGAGVGGHDRSLDALTLNSK